MSQWLKRFEKTGNLEFTDDDFRRYHAQIKEDLKFYRKYLKKGKVLELGCGLGCTAVPLSHYYDVACVDRDKEVLKYAKLNGKKYGKNMKFMLKDLFDIDKLSKKYDACTSGGVMEHFPERKIKILLKKQLKVAPLILFSVPVRTKRNLKAYGTRKLKREVHADGIYRNLWTVDYWINVILKNFNVVEYRKAKFRDGISGVDELMIAIKR